MRLSSVLVCLAVLQPLGAAAAAQRAPAPVPGQIVVLGADGQPAGEASVTVLMPGRGGVSPADEILVRGGTTEDGVIEDAVPRLHGLMLVIDHPAHLPFVGQYPNRPPPSEIRLQAGRTAEGVVREADGGRTVEGAQVCTVWQDPNLPDWFGTLRRCADSGERGAFELAGLPAANLRATADAAGFETDSRTIEQGRRAPRVVFELVAREEPATEAETGPAGAGEVRVELVGAAGEPIRNFTMRTNAVGRMGGASHDVEDAEGPVLVPISPSFGGDTTVDLSFRAENYLESSLIRVAPVPGGEIELGLIALDSGSVVQGRLFDAVGAEPAAGCLVELLPPGAGAVAALMLRQRHVTVSDPEGGYMFGGLRAGRYHLRLQCPEVPVADRLIVLGANELADQGESWLDSGRPVAVQVTGIAGGTVRLLDRFREVEAPIVQATLQVPPEAEARQRSGEDSRVRADFKAAPDVYRLEVLDASGRLRVSQEVAVEEGPAEVQTIGVATATRVIQSILVMDGRPVTGGHVSFSRVFEPSRSSGKLQIVSQRPGGSRQQRVLGIPPQAVGGAVGLDGAFEVAGAPTDLLWMTWRAEGGNVGRLWPEGPLPRMDLNGVRVTGELLDVNGAPIGGQVSLIGDVGRTVAYAEAGDDGRFELPPAPPGSYRLKASAGVSPTRAREGRSSLAGTVVQDLALGTGPPPHLVLRVGDAETGVLEVELQRADGSPAAGAWLHFVNASGDMVNTSLASVAGQASRNLPAGDISLVWNDGAACAGGLGVNVEAGRTATVRESLPIGRLLELRCPAADCGGEALSFLSMTTESGAEIASHLTGAGESVRFSDSGRLGLGCVTPGSYEVSFWAAGQRWGAEVTVGSKGNLEEPVVVTGRAAGL
ncbi:MAG: carboxypeptidase regulatory-like domain-containing protein [Holophagales bacterium]|nr:carboxypeptidase regulatory-like domain-containing protein [Holophagales bacterium]MYG31662.1 carboxypeptidase regulatory-like domain-containing protein [Holophagales bacterium]MYI79504.1 carboxypeptidase regulatory-like domain-containing protein [Holophagales bacterium]